jgi:iron complex outermembrane receptor protein
MPRPALPVLLTLLFAPQAVLADEAAGDDLHREIAPDIVVTAPFARDRADLLGGVSIVSGATLTRELRPTIGDTLSRQAGVSSTSFGPNASRPILRGFQGERIRVLTDGIGSFDVSNTSVDHAVIINPLLAERIEVLRGPASLLYGSAAIGGVVNVIGKDIPTEVPQEPVHADAIGTYGSAASERSLGGLVSVPLGPRFVVQANGSYSRTDDLRIGSYVLSAPVRAQALASEDPAVNALADLRGRLPNSASKTWTAGLSAAYIDSVGEFGIGYTHYDSLYGVPPRFDLETGEGEKVRLKVRQDRVDARARLTVGGDVIDSLKFRFGYADYRHSELSETGEIGTTFLNKGMEARLEAVQSRRDIGSGTWRGASGVQILTRDFNVIGDEAFLPRNSTVQTGLFTLQEFDFGALKAEGAGRFERSAIRSTVGDFRGAPVALDRAFSLFSGSIGASLALAEGWRVGVNLSHTERSPAAEELLANGPHAGTQSFEIGNPDFAKERANGAELVLRGSSDRFSFEGSLYYTRFHNYIYDALTGDVEDGLPVFQFYQAGARYLGFEAQASATVARLGETDLKIDALADYTDAKLLGGGGPVPRIPPLRLLGGVEAVAPVWSARAEVEHASRQTKISAFETETAPFTLVNMSFSWKPMGEASRTSLQLSANNIFDVDARRHASFLKDFAPLAGRDIRLSARVSF